MGTLPLRESLQRHTSSPYLQVLRCDLIELLVNAAYDIGVKLHENHEVADVDRAENRVSLRTGHASGPFDLLIGADGSHSIVRKSFDSIPPARYAGDIAYRTLIPLSKLPEEFGEASIRLYAGRHRHLVAYPIHSRAVLNCVFVVGKAKWQAESWCDFGSTSSLMNAFSHWHESITRLIESVDEARLYRWGLHAHPFLKPHQWCSGRKVLIGDAAHVLLPYLAQGGALAIEDAVALAEHIDTPNLELGLMAFASRRSSRSRAVGIMSKRNRLAYHLMWPWTTIRNMLLPLVFQRIVRKVYLNG